MAGNGFFLANNGANYPVQANLQGQYHNELVATAGSAKVIEDLTVRLDYQHRWLGNIIEDGSTDSGGYTFVLANPGNVSLGLAIDSAKSERDQANQAATNAQAMLDAAVTANPMDPNIPALRVDVDEHERGPRPTPQAKVATLQDFQTVPKPKRTYDAINRLGATKRFSKNWLTRASYT